MNYFVLVWKLFQSELRGDMPAAIIHQREIWKKKITSVCLFSIEKSVDSNFVNWKKKIESRDYCLGGCCGVGWPESSLPLAVVIRPAGWPSHPTKWNGWRCCFSWAATAVASAAQCRNGRVRDFDHFCFSCSPVSWRRGLTFKRMQGTAHP